MKIFLVGGAVRDQQLGLPVGEKDWLVTGATVEQMLAKGYLQIDSEFPVFKHPETAEEYALARTETKVGSGYKGFVVESGPQITLEQDLARRDLTINAIAMDENGQLIDPFHGLDDLRDGKLRHVTKAFVEDPVRLLRTARFAAVLGEYGFSVSHETFGLLKQMSVVDELKAIKPERFQREMNKAMAARQCWKFFKVLGKCGALDILLPGINVLINGEQMVHGEDAEPILALQRATEISNDLSVRLATVMYHAVVEQNFALENYLPIEKSLRQLMDALRQHSAELLQGCEAASLLAHLEKAGAFKQGERFKQVMDVLQSVFPPHDKRIRGLRYLHGELQATSAESLMQKGYSGVQLGEEIRIQRITLVDQWLSNQ